MRNMGGHRRTGVYTVGIWVNIGEQGWTQEQQGKTQAEGWTRRNTGVNRRIGVHIRKEKG
jgi:hypothetical protein